MAAIYPLAFVAKTEVGDWPVLGAVTKALNTIYVTRESVLSRVQCIHQLKNQVSRINYCVFPEGTTTDGRRPRIQNWKAGNLALSLNPDLRVVIVGISYQDHEDLSWIDDMTLFLILEGFTEAGSPGPNRVRELEEDEIDRSTSGCHQRRCEAVEAFAKGDQKPFKVLVRL